MRLCLARLSATFLCAAWLFCALPASAKPAESQDNSLSTELGRLASTLTTQAERAIEAGGDAAARALHDGQGIFAEAQSDIAKSFEKFSHALNEQKADLGMIAEDAVARLKAWQQETIAAWPDTWGETMSEMHHSAIEALNRLHDWLKKQTASEEPAQIPFDPLFKTERATMTDKTPDTQQADKEWADLQRDLDTLGEQLSSLRDHSGALGDTVMSNLEARYQDVRNRALGYRSATEEQLEAMRKLALEQAAQTQNTLSETTKDTARQMWDRSEPLRQGAQEVGQGLVRAWSELAASFGKAAERIQAEKAKAATGEETHKPS